MKMSRNKILVAVDFEEQSMAALEHSYHIARLFEAEIVLLYVIETGGVFEKLFSPQEYVEKVMTKARDKFDELDKLAHTTKTKSAIAVSSLIEKGKPYDKIIDVAKDQDVLLIVMGLSGNLERRGRKFIGSNTFNVIREADCPVISVKAGNQNNGEFTNILLPLDFTKQTKKQVQKAIEFGGYFGATINVLSVLTGESKVTRLLKQVQLTQVRNAITRHGIRCHTELIDAKEKSVSDIILDHSSKIHADLVIIMTQQKKNFVEYFIGSTAQEVIAGSDIPVLSIIPSAEFRPGVVTSMVDPLGLMEKNDLTDEL